MSSAFQKKQAPDLGRPPAHRQQNAHLRRAFFHAEMKEQRQKNQRRRRQKETEADEQTAELLRLRAGGQRLLAHGREGQADGGRI